MEFSIYLKQEELGCKEVKKEIHILHLHGSRGIDRSPNCGPPKGERLRLSYCLLYTMSECLELNSVSLFHYPTVRSSININTKR